MLGGKIMKKLLSLITALLMLVCMVPVSASGANADWTPDSDTMDTYRIVAGKNHGGDTKYTNYRIPGIVVTQKDTVIVYFEARMTSSDWADMDILAMRSEDGGKTFGDPIIVAEGAISGRTMNNPVMIVGGDGTLHILYCVEYGVCTKCGQGATLACTHGPGVYHSMSHDDGKTWSEPTNISNDTYSADVNHNVIATGPGHGIALSDGTLIATVWLVEPQNCKGSITSHHVGSVSTLYSKDNGKSWHIGEIVPNDDLDGSAVLDPNETMPVETSDGGVMLNIRSGGGGYRALAWSPNGYSDWTTMEYDRTLIDPTCMGSVAKYDIEGDPYTVLLVNCESASGRRNLVLKGSLDDGKTWKYRTVIEPGAAGYSDIAVDSKGTIYVLYEVDAGVTCNLARLNYKYFVSNSETLTPPKEVNENSMILHLDGKSYADASGYQKKSVPTDVTLDSSKSAFGGGSYGFNGNSGDSSVLSIEPTNGLMAGEKAFTYSLWFNLDSTKSHMKDQQILFWYGNVGTGAAQVWCRTNGDDLQCNVASGGVETTLTATDVLKTGVWHHAVIVRDGTDHYLYLDGSLAASAKSAKVHNLVCAEALTVGASRGTTHNRFVDGNIDEFMYFNYALSADEIAKLNQNGTLTDVCERDEECPISGYTDLNADSEYHDALHYILENGIMNGTGAGKFTPGGTLTRAMVVTVLWRMEDEPMVNCIMKFEDVPMDEWYTEAVRFASCVGIVNGYSETVFAPNDSITREQLATILYRYAKADQASQSVLSEYSDGKEVSDWAAPAVAWATENGILTPIDGNISPKSEATRLQTASALYALSQIK